MEESKMDQHLRGLDLVKDLFSILNENQIFGERYCTLHELCNRISDNAANIKATVNKNLQGKDTDMNTKLTNLNSKFQRNEKELAKIFHQLELKKQEYEIIKEKILTKIDIKMEKEGEEQASCDVNADSNETSIHLKGDIETNKTEHDVNMAKKTKHVPDPERQIPSQKDDSEEAITELQEIQKTLEELMQDMTMKHNQLTAINDRLQADVLQLLSFSGAAEESTNMTDTEREQAVTILYDKFKKILDELSNASTSEYLLEQKLSSINI